MEKFKRRLRKYLIYKIVREFKKGLLKVRSVTLSKLGKNIHEVIQEHRNEREYGIETSGGSYCTDDDTTYHDSHMYSPIPYSDLERIIFRLNCNSQDVFVDIGCGKGRVLVFVAQTKIKKIIGIEFRKDLAEDAIQNIKKIKNKLLHIKIINADAAKCDLREGTIFFMYSPFGESTFKAVIENIKSTYVKNPRSISIVYFDIKISRIEQIFSFMQDQGWLFFKEKVNCSGHAYIWQTIDN
jgi:precorrin-6B methylase 2